jgi:hypothetical protein
LDEELGMFAPFVSSLGIATALDMLFRDRNLHPPLFPTDQSYKQAQQVQNIFVCASFAPCVVVAKLRTCAMQPQCRPK